MAGATLNKTCIPARCGAVHAHLVVALVALAVALSTGQWLFAANADAAPACADLLLVFARGSGQTPEEDSHRSSETSTFFREIRSHTPDRLNIAKSRLGEPGYRGYAYPAVHWLTFGNIFTLNSRYRDSVEEGSAELVSFLTDRRLRCPGEEWIIGGYSQGGEVVSSTLGLLADGVRDRVGFAATFGDPTLDAYGGFPCRRAWWARGNVKCFQQGILGGRVPYVPKDMKGRYGAWCDWLDPICARTYFGSAHGHYPRAAIPKAALEATSVVRFHRDRTLRNIHSALTLRRRSDARRR